MGTVVNRALPFLYRGSLEITLTVSSLYFLKKGSLKMYAHFTQFCYDSFLK